MKILILNTDYHIFLKQLYINDNLTNAPYDQQMQARNDSLFGVADFYSSNLIKLGHQAQEIHANNKFMQIEWAKEHGYYNNIIHKYNFRKIVYPVISPLERNPSWFFNILAKQIEYYKPDIIINQAMDGISGRFMQKMKRQTKLLVGQIASPLPERENFRIYDLILTSLPNFITYFTEIGVPCELNKLAFEPKVLEKINNNSKTIPVSFVGSMSPHHNQRTQLLEYLCNKNNINIWGNGIEDLPKESPIHKFYKGTAWGLEMYQILHDSKITINNHIGISGDYANNMRLYEATGSGALLITDYKKNIDEIFKIGKEVIVYHNVEECSELINYYLDHEDEREAISLAGQERTLKDHNYYKRMQELMNIVNKYI